METIHIAFICSDEYAKYMATTMVSILHNNKSSRDYHFHVITSSITDNSKATIQRLQKKYKFDISYIHIKENDERLKPVQGIRQPAHVGLQSIFIRLMLPDILPTLDKVLSMDVDLYVRDDLASLYDTDLKDYCLAAVEDVAETVFANFLWNDPHHHFYNTGVMLQNLKQMRNIGYRSILVNTLRANSRKYRIGEQDSFNDIYKDKICHLNYTWNFYHSFHFDIKRFTPDYPNEFQEADKNPTIVHFVGPEKPWFPCMKHPYKSDYMFYYRKNPFYRFNIFDRFDYRLRYSSHKEFKFMGIDVLSIKETNSNKKIKFFHIPIYRRKKGDRLVKYLFGIPYNSKKKAAWGEKSKFIFGLYKIIRKKDSLKRYILGVPFWIHKNSPQREIIKLFWVPIYRKNKQTILIQNIVQNSIQSLNTQLLSIQNELKKLKEWCYKASYFPSVVADVHRNNLLPFKNAYTETSLAICGCGPTLNYYKQLPNVKHISLNRAFEKEELKYDYLFFWDYIGLTKNGEHTHQKIKEYPAKKFIGRFLNADLPQVSEQQLKNLDAVTFYSSALHGFPLPAWDNEIHYDIEHYPLMDFGSIAFGAFHFALYSGAKTIYLVGIDNTRAGYFSKEHKQQFFRTELILEGWKKVKRFCSIHYPDVQIISVNPVGLKGIFTDVYTKEYLAEHPEISSPQVLQ